ncbi:MAG: hypothetical protein S4CHLAM20_05310 [Chlamydiia bacterium]|nr:hypothetical protein [Chlamydiia bacterium]
MSKQKQPLIISYYSEGTLYEKEAVDLKASCEKLGLEHEICEVPNLGSWEKNCCYKPTFILEKLAEHNRPIIWTDIDSVVLKNPEILLNCQADCALRVNDDVPPTHQSKIMSGTMFFNNTASAKKLLTLWEKECEKELERDGLTYDQACLRKVVLHYPTIVEMKRLPVSYVKVVDSKEDQEKDPDNVIVHYPASRLLGPIVDGEVVPAIVDGMNGQELKNLRTT